MIPTTKVNLNTEPHRLPTPQDFAGRKITKELRAELVAAIQEHNRAWSMQSTPEHDGLRLMLAEVDVELGRRRG